MFPSQDEGAVSWSTSNPPVPSEFYEVSTSQNTLNVSKPNITSSHLPASKENEIEVLVNLGSGDEDDDDPEQRPLVIPRTLKVFIDQDQEDDEQDTADSVIPNCQIGDKRLYDFKWSPLPRPPISPDTRREAFVKEVGPTIHVSEPYEAFTAIWDPAIINHIVAETNKYAEETIQRRCSIMGKYSRLQYWNPVNADDIMTYFGILMAMSLVQKNVMVDYWSQDNDLLATPNFSSVISRNKFQLISRCLHFNDNSLLNPNATPETAKVHKLKPILDHLNSKFSELYVMEQNISIDRCLPQWEGCLSGNQLIPNKSTDAGIKTYEVWESKTGYLYRFDVHSDEKHAVASGVDLPITGFIPSLVFRLLEGLDNSGYTVWMDNFYTTPVLARVLKSKGFDCVGTLRTNQAFVPTELNKLKTYKTPMSKNVVSGCTSGDVDLMVWSKMTKRIPFLTTYHGAAKVFCPTKSKSIPAVAWEYNERMSGLDKKDQILSQFQLDRKRRKVWYKKMFHQLLNVSILNASVLFNHGNTRTHPQLSQREFRITLLKSIIEHHTVRRIPRPLVDPDMRTLPASAVDHLTVASKIIEGTKRHKKITCSVCHKRVRTICPKCNVGLCLSPCAQSYHKGKV